jgi:hypothetical protein
VDTVPQMAQAVQRMNRLSNMQDGVSDTIQYFLDRLYTSRQDPPPSPYQPPLWFTIFQEFERPEKSFLKY